MAEKKVLVPGPDHPITVEPTAGRVVVKAGGRVIADSRAAQTLQEASYPGIQYIPRADVDFGVLERTEHETYCPYKGDASYYSLKLDGKTAENVVWTYETPHDPVVGIKDHLAFYPDSVDSIELTD